MAERLPPAYVVPPSTPDDEIPAEKVETKLAAQRKARRDGRFLMGPVPLQWIREHIRHPSDRLL